MQFPAIDPVAFSIGSLQLRWYGLMYLLAFFVGWGLARWRASRPGSGWKTVDVDDLLTFVMLGVILGARLGYVLFYDLPAYIDDPGEILRIWNGGMSFHGGLLGVLCAFWYFAHPQEVLPRGLGLHRAAGAAGPVLGPHGQLHQRRALGQGQRRALGHGLPHRRALAAPPLAAL